MPSVAQCAKPQVAGWLVNWKGRGRKGLQLCQREYSRFPRTTEEIQKSLTMTCFQAKILILKVPEYEEGMQIIQPRRSLKLNTKKKEPMFLTGSDCVMCNGLYYV